MDVTRRTVLVAAAAVAAGAAAVLAVSAGPVGDVPAPSSSVQAPTPAPTPSVDKVALVDGLVGLDWEQAVARVRAAGYNPRVVRPGQGYTLDARADRVTLLLGGDGTVEHAFGA